MDAATVATRVVVFDARLHGSTAATGVPAVAPMTPPPPPPCWSCVLQCAACIVPGPGMHRAVSHGGVVPVLHGVMAMAANCGLAPCARPRCHRKVSAGMW